MLVVDDHPAFRASVCRLLEASGFGPVHQAANGAAATPIFRSVQPDLVLLDVQLPDSDGIALAEEMVGSGQDSTVILISSRSASEYGPRLSQSRSAGFIRKDELTPERIRAMMPSTP